MQDLTPQEIIARDRSRLAAALQTGVVQNPDEEAGLRREATQRGMAPEVLRTAKAQKTPLPPALGAWYDMPERAPRAAGFLSNPQNAAIAHDDTDNLTLAEQTMGVLKNIGGSLYSGLPRLSAGLVGRVEAAEDVSDAVLGAPFRAVERLLGTNVGERNTALRRQQRGDYRRYLSSASEAALAKSDNPIEQAAYSGVASIAPSALGILVGMFAGPTAGAAVIAGPVGGEAYGRARDQGKAIVPALAYGETQASAEFLGERIGLGPLLDGLKMGSPFLQTFVKTQIAEQVGEQATTVLQDFTDYAMLNPGQTFAEFLAERPDAALQTAVATAVGSGATTSGAYALQATAQRLDRNDRQRRAAMRDNSLVQQLNAVAEASKVRARSPETFEQFVGDLAQDGPVDTLYVDAQTFNQTLEAAGISVADVEAAVPAVAEQLSNALRDGGDLAIPVEQFATRISGTDFAQPLLDHLRVNPALPSRAEVMALGQEANEALQAEVEAVLTAEVTTDAFRQSAERVKASLAEQLNTAGRFTKDVNDVYASLHVAYYTVRAAQLGITPEQFAARYPLQIRAELPTAKGQATLDQEAQVRLVHYSPTPGLTQTDPSLWGQNARATTRAERGRRDMAPPRTYFYDPAVRNSAAEAVIQSTSPFMYETRVPASKLYDFDADPLGLKPSAEALTDEQAAAFETAVRDAGFLGYRFNSVVNGGVALFEAAPVQAAGPIRTAEQAKALEARIADLNRQRSVARIEGEPDPFGGQDTRELALAEQEQVLLNQAQVPDAPAAGDPARYQPLEGAPKSVKVGDTRIQVGPFAPARDAAYDYMASRGLAYQPPTEYAKVDVPRAGRIADAFEQMAHQPNDPVVRAAYDALIEETLAQYQFVKATGLTAEFIAEGQADPYAASPRLATQDVVENNHLWVFPTDDGFGGSASSDVDISGNPLLSLTDEWIGDKQLRANDVFRIVHDYFGHVKDGTGFRAEGEENAWQSHAAMFTPLARRAMTTETRGQNSWVNYGPFAEFNRTANAGETQYAPQKIGLLPEWASSEGFLGGAETGTNAETPVTYGQSATLRSGRETLKKYGLDPNRRYSTREVAAALEARQRAKYGSISKTDRSDEAAKRIAGWMAEEVQFEMQNPNSSGVGWYSTKFQAALSTFAQEFPELREDQGARDLMTALIAITSDGQKVVPNFQQAAGIYRNFKRDGKFVADRGTQRQSSVDGNLAKVQEMYDTLGAEGMRAALLEELTVSELKKKAAALGVQFSTSYQASVRLPLAALVFGPKLGAFYANLMGADGYLTMDRWWSRTFNRYRGSLLQAPTAEGIARFRELLGEPGLSDDQVVAATVGPRNSYAARNFKDGSEIEKAANTIYKAAFENLEDQPFNATDRSFMLKVVEQARKALARRGVDISVADIQAVLWYYEKRLYGELGARQTADISYEEAAQRVVEEARVAAAGGQTVLGSDTAEGAYPGDEIFDGEIVLEQRNRGQIAFSGDITQTPSVISLLRTADLSTFLHETGHYFLEVDAHIASQPDAPAEVVADVERLLSWFGVADLATWNAMGVEEKRQFHEQFARGFEAFLLEGKSPTPELQSIFQRFRSWLMNVYKSLASLNVELTEEVRDVMGRMVASAEAIQNAEDVRHFKPLAETRPPYMTEQAWDEYQRAFAAATAEGLDTLSTRTVRDMKWLANARSRALKRLQAQANDARRQVRAEVTAEVNAEPVNRARRFITRGTDENNEPIPGAGKLDLATLREMYGEGPDALWRQLRAGGKYGEAGNNGIHPDVVAENFGFSSGDALVRELIAAENAQEKIAGLTDQRMLERYGDIADEQAMDRATDEAIANDARARVLATEYAALAEATGQPRALAAAARQYAAGIVNRIELKRLKPHQFFAASARAGRQADAALKKDDLGAAATAKRNQLVNMQAARYTLDAKREVDQALTLYKRIIGANDEALARSRDMALVNATRALLAQYGLTRMKNDPMGYLERVKAYDPQLYADIEVFLKMGPANAKPFSDMTFEEFQGMHDVVRQLWTLSRRTRQIEIDGKLVDLELARNELGARLDELGYPDNAAGNSRAPTDAEKRKRLLQGARASLRRVESWSRGMDGDSAGVFRRYIWNPVSAGSDRYRAAQGVYLQRFLDLVKPIEADLARKAKIEAAEIGYTFNSKAELLHAILHSGNQSNLSKLLLGRRWGRKAADGSLDTTQWDAFVSRMWAEGKLTKADYDFAQSVWDLLDELKPAAQEAHRNMYGRYFDEITADEISTPFGTYRGGYVPATTDAFMVQDAALRAEQEAIEDSNSAMFPAASNGFTKSRVEDYTRELALDVRLLPMHIDKVLKFTYIGPPVRDVARLLKGRDFSAKLQAFDPVAQSDLLLPWLQRAAKQIVMTPTAGAAGKMVDTFFREMRSRTGMQLMFANLSNTAQQVTGFSNLALRVKKRNLQSAMWKYFRNPKGVAEAVAGLSSFMSTRTTGQVFEARQTIEQMLLNPNKYEKLRDFSARHAYFFQTAAQNFTDIIGWSAAYDQAVAEGQDDAEAIRFADSVIRETQGSMAPEDVSRAETGPAFMRMFTQFWSYFNNQANLLGTEFQQVARGVGVRKGAGRLFYIYLMGYAVPALMADAIAVMFRGGLDDDEDDGYLDELLQWFFMGQVKFGLAAVPVVGQVTNAAIGAFTDVPYDDRVSVSPAVSVVESGARLPAEVYQTLVEGESFNRRDVRDLMNMLGIISGTPIGALGRPVSYGVGVAQGDIEPTGPVDVARGLVTGAPSPESRTNN